MVQVTTVWEAEQVAACLRCGSEMTVAPHVMGVEVAPGAYLCDPCFFHVFDGSKARAREALGLEPEGNGPDGGPAPAAPAARPGVLTRIAAGAGPVGYELSPEEERELIEFEQAVRESAPDPEPCIACARPASPRLETEAGPLCFACADGGAGGEELQRAVRLSRTVARLLAARTALAVPVPAQVPVIAR